MTPGATRLATTSGRPQSPGEEIANAVSHGLACLLSVAGWPMLVEHAARQGTPLDEAAAAIFVGTMVLLYGVSALYHALPMGQAKGWLNRLDHAAIYVFIAGSYTPFTVSALHGGWGWTMFTLVWSLAALGVAVKLLNRLRHPVVSTGLYLIMGWSAVLAAAPAVAQMSGGGLAWLMAGGLCYTLGAVAFLLDHRVRYAHFVWHLFVVAGSACHVLAAMRHLP
ncbi:hemolysin III family protein [Ideonella sp. A 288]|uniref:PAQR family membrane homeostasis protein TrhA n=1 Tax=Ideonella sp. A 288 TaxID=1962181 RepID=UPI001F1F3679|nr:hemolysin III family protein [Ideonella sp. A 288]